MTPRWTPEQLREEADLWAEDTRKDAVRLHSKLHQAADDAEALARVTAELDALKAKVESFAVPTPGDGWRMDAYYYSFTGTGIAAIDKILSAVACAGKAAHHTDGWRDDTGPREPHTGNTPVEWIQNAANESAAILKGDQ